MTVKLRRKKLKDGRVSLYLDCYSGGRRSYEFLKLYVVKGRTQQNKDVLLLANSIRDKRALDLASARHGSVATYRKNISLVSFVEGVAKQKTTKGTWRSLVVHLRAFAGDSLPIGEVTAAWLEEFKAYLQAQVSHNTASTYLINLKTALRAATGRVISHNPAVGLAGIKRTDTERSFLVLDEIKKLAATDCETPETKRAFLFACFCGLRLSDVELLKWEHVKGDQLQFRQKKTSTREYLPISQTAKGFLYQGRGNTLPLPSTRVFALQSRHHTRTTLQAWVKAAGISKAVSFHTARHTFATLSLTHGVDLFTVSKLLGHKSLQSTQVYGRIVDERKQQAVAMLPKLKMRK